MKLGVLIETVFTSVNGGRPNTDSSVLREDIKALVPAAVNYAMTGDYWARLKNDGDREIPNAFVTELEYQGVCCDNYGREYIELADTLIHLAGNGGVRYVTDVKGNSYAPIALGSSASFWDGVLNTNKEYQYKNKKIYLKNRPELSDLFFVGVLLDVSGMDDDAELPIPAGSEPEVVDLLINFFTNQRMQPKEYVINGVDPVNEVR